MDFTSFINQLPILAAAVLVISEVIFKYVTVEGWAARIVTWVISIGLVFASPYIPLVTSFVDVSVFSKLFYGIIIGLVANGLFSIDQLKALLEKLGLRSGLTAIK